MARVGGGGGSDALSRNVWAHHEFSETEFFQEKGV